MSESSPITKPDERRSRGKLKIFLGYAAGVGKTYQMLVEAQALKASGVDVVIGYFEPHARKDTIAQTEGLEVVPRRREAHRESVFEDMNTEALLRRHPQACVVDEFAHTNIPGSLRKKRWEDVNVLLDAGIDVLTSLNIQHIESLNDQVWHVTGIRVRETVPDWELQSADEVVMVDVTPRALLHRLERGVIYGSEKARQAMEHFFTESNLIALRELALRQTAHHIEDRREEKESESDPSSPASFANRERERILLWLTDDPRTAMLIRRGRRIADFLHAECLGVLVARERDSSEIRCAEERHINFAQNLQISVEVLRSPDAAQTVADYARAHEVKQILVTRQTPKIPDLVRMVKDIQVTIVGSR